MSLLDWAMLAVYFALLIIIGVQTIRRVKTTDDFAVAGNRIIWPVFFGSLAAAFLGGGASLGNSGAVFRDGYAYMFAFFAFSVQTVLVGLFVAPRLKRYMGAHTVGDVMEHHYGRASRLLTGLVSLGLCAGVLGAQALAIGTIVDATLGLPPVPSIVIGMAVVVLYSSFGGAWAVVQTDMLQFVFLGVFIPVTLLLALGKAGGPGHVLAAVPDAHLSLTGGWTIGAFLGLFLAFLLGETLVPPYAQRAFSTPDARNARRGMVLAGIFSFFFFFVTASIGIVARVLYPGISPDLVLPTVVMRLIPAGLVGLVIAALLAVVMSTASSYLNSIAVIFVKDIYQPFINPEVSAARRVWLERALSVLVGVVAIAFAVSVPSIVDALLYAYGVWAPTVIIPLLAAVLFKSRNKAAGLAAMAAGGTVMAVWTWVLDEPYGVTGLVAGVTTNLLAFVVTSLLTGGRRTPEGEPPVPSAAVTAEN
ncbi:sodium:solute symporter family protein [Streptomyces oryzae]|uniref:Sodium:solute symporter family protein n=1 Tax=Streptomyces oryzae TaxID=1434886 RepID=A0ABS3X6T7_9ACTN|nr:sodium:solute symporter family protein [Streptomyces oryzae]MBO8191093.1 sodium:solute symporter family protein [Streptomyces oryzae]